MISYIKSCMPITSNDAIIINLDLKVGRFEANVTVNGPRV